MRIWVSLLAIAGGTSVLSTLPQITDEALQAMSGYDQKPLLALFTSESCQRCGSVEHALARARPDILKALLEGGVDQSVVEKLDFVKLDLHNNTQAKAEFQVEGVPTVLLVKPSHVHEYGGPTTSSSLSKWLTKRLAPAMQTLMDNEQEIADFVAAHEVSVVIETDEQTAQTFSTLIESIREIPTYGWVNIPNLEQNAERFNRIRLYKRGLASPITTTYKQLKEKVGAETDAATLAWLYENQLPLFGEINLSNLHAYLHNHRPFVWFVGDADWHRRFEREMNSLILDEALGGKFWWVWLDPDGGEANLSFIKESLRPPQIPGWVITDYRGPGRFPLNIEHMHKIDRHTITRWLTSVLEDKEERQLLSDPIPLEDVSINTGIEWIVTNNLVDKLKRKDRPSDIFLVVESMWCDECLELLAAEVQVAHAVRDTQTHGCLRMARIEAHSNELDPDWDLQSASAFLFPLDPDAPTKSVKDMIKVPYQEEPTADGLLSFFKRNGKCKGLEHIKPANLKVSVKEEL